MRKIYLTLAAAAISLGAMAQMPRLATPNHRVDISNVKNVSSTVTGPVKSTNAMVNFWLDYSSANFDDLFYVWTFNSGYVAADTTGGEINPINIAAVGITGPLAGYTDPADIANSINEWSYFNGPITIDSIFGVVTHENNSGEYDKIIMEIVTLNGTGTPTSTVLWSATDSSNTTLSPGGNWVGTDASVLLSYAPNFTTTQGQAIGLNLRYVGNKADTFSVIAGSIDDGAGGTTQQSQYQNSWTRIPPFIPSITKNANIGYGSPVGSSGWFEAQNWAFWAYVSYDATSVSENAFIKGVKISQNFPNPANKVTNFSYELQKSTNVSFEIYDMNGRLVKEVNEGRVEPGKHKYTIDVDQFNSGVYFFTIKTNETSITKRMVITK
jgi:hypothetical protein